MAERIRPSRSSISEAACVLVCFPTEAKSVRKSGSSRLGFATEGTKKGADETMMIFHWKYLDESLPLRQQGPDGIVERHKLEALPGVGRGELPGQRFRDRIHVALGGAQRRSQTAKGLNDLGPGGAGHPR